MSRAVVVAKRWSDLPPIDRPSKGLDFTGALRTEVGCELPMTAAALATRRQVSAPGLAGLRAEFLMEGG